MQAYHVFPICLKLAPILPVCKKNDTMSCVDGPREPFGIGGSSALTAFSSCCSIQDIGSFCFVCVSFQMFGNFIVLCIISQRTQMFCIRLISNSSNLLDIFVKFVMNVLKKSSISTEFARSCHLTAARAASAARYGLHKAQAFKTIGFIWPPVPLMPDGSWGAVHWRHQRFYQYLKRSLT